MVADAGFTKMGLRVHQPADRAGASGLLLKWSVQEAGPAFVGAGLLTEDELQRTIREMESATEDPDVLALALRMSLVWGQRPSA